MNDPNTTIFLGCGFAAKYLHGGGNFSVPLQWILGLKRLRLNAVWIELLPATSDLQRDHLHIQNFQTQLLEHGLEGHYCLLYQKPPSTEHDLDRMECFGMSKAELETRLNGPNTLLNLSHSLHPPFIYRFERRIYCDIDPGEISYWMARMEMGQSYHHEFWTIGLNIHSPDCRLPKTSIPWKTFYPLVDTELIQPRPIPHLTRFTTIGQWYWHQGIEIDGGYPDLSKKACFEKYMELPRHVKGAILELAMNLNPDDPEIDRIRSYGWNLVSPHEIASSPTDYRRYIAESFAEFTACKGVDVPWKTGWVSDRAATYLATGRPVITEDTGASRYLPSVSGILWIHDLDSAKEATSRVMSQWDELSQHARRTAVEYFDSTTNLQRILGIQ